MLGLFWEHFLMGPPTFPVLDAQHPLPREECGFSHFSQKSSGPLRKFDEFQYKWPTPIWRISQFLDTLDILRLPRKATRRMLYFLGRLMGICVRRGDIVPLSLCSTTWKSIRRRTLVCRDHGYLKRGTGARFG